MRPWFVTAMIFLTGEASSAELLPSDYSNIENIEIRTIRFDIESDGEKRAIVAIKNISNVPVSVSFDCSSFTSNGQPEDFAFGNVLMVPPGQEIVDKSSSLSAASEKAVCRISDVQEAN